MDAITLPSRQSTIALQDITVHNWAPVTRLFVNRDQTALVVPNLESLCEHQFYTPRSVVRAVVADTHTPVGYIRFQEQDSSEPYVKNNSAESTDGEGVYRLLSFMIDQACQGLCFGTKAMLLLQQELCRIQGFREIRVSTATFSTAHPDDSPEHFFAGLGFEKSKDGALETQAMIWTLPS
ncbi:hypothetical protein BGZ99_008001 [Dissophora globulifera]|uniref:N-acetyltransferase domain-containing protein n=1 Tax=Dissophora globulifera TaxID=979702 RepID=A0A9P6UZS0_9FUNG|nr:hypothetical protein BGZ99_008001 [Dissophora globulifera]